jgi:hypothetical protein
MGARGLDAVVIDPEFWHKSPVRGLNREQYVFLMGRPFRWTEPDSPWVTEAETKRAWRKYRAELVAQCPPGRRPLAFWYFDRGLREDELPHYEEHEAAGIIRFRCWRDEDELEACREIIRKAEESDRIIARNEAARIASLGPRRR